MVLSHGSELVVHYSKLLAIYQPRGVIRHVYTMKVLRGAATGSSSDDNQIIVFVFSVAARVTTSGTVQSRKMEVLSVFGYSTS